MKLPESLFVVINPVVRFLLRSPIHGFWSDSLMLISFRGRTSQKEFTTPVRFVRVGDTVRCFTSAKNQWWRNVRGGADVRLRIKGEEKPYRAIAIENDPAQVRQWLQYYLGKFPQDAAYHEIRLNKDQGLVAEDMDAAAKSAIMVEATPI